MSCNRIRMSSRDRLNEWMVNANTVSWIFVTQGHFVPVCLSLARSFSFPHGLLKSSKDHFRRANPLFKKVPSSHSKSSPIFSRFRPGWEVFASPQARRITFFSHSLSPIYFSFFQCFIKSRRENRLWTSVLLFSPRHSSLDLFGRWWSEDFSEWDCLDFFFSNHPYLDQGSFEIGGPAHPVEPPLRAQISRRRGPQVSKYQPTNQRVSESVSQWGSEWARKRWSKIKGDYWSTSPLRDLSCCCRFLARPNAHESMEKIGDLQGCGWSHRLKRTEQPLLIFPKLWSFIKVKIPNPKPFSNGNELSTVFLDLHERPLWRRTKKARALLKRIKNELHLTLTCCFHRSLVLVNQVSILECVFHPLKERDEHDDITRTTTFALPGQCTTNLLKNEAVK